MAARPGAGRKPAVRGEKPKAEVVASVPNRCGCGCDTSTSARR